MTSPIEPLLQKLNSTPQDVTADEIGVAMAMIFSNDLTPEYTKPLLQALTKTGLEQRPDVLAKSASIMVAASLPMNEAALTAAIKARNLGKGDYQGGLCDVVGTGGDGHKTFNISTTSSIVASPFLLMGKHGNRASTSMSGSADVLQKMEPPLRSKLEAVTPDNLPALLERTNYSFLFAPNFHTGLARVAALRKALQHPTIFNLLGPLCNPADVGIEARVIGVKKIDLVPVFAEALRLNGVKKALIVCGEENLDEVSCAGPTRVAMVSKREGAPIDIEYFIVSPEDFGLPRHELSEVSPGKNPEENAAILKKLISGELSEDNPILHFVLMNAAALLAISGICTSGQDPWGNHEKVITTRGPGGLYWREGARLANEACKRGLGVEMLQKFAGFTNGLT